MNAPTVGVNHLNHKENEMIWPLIFVCSLLVIQAGMSVAELPDTYSLVLGSLVMLIGMLMMLASAYAMSRSERFRDE
jgi:hypothetical protein